MVSLIFCFWALTILPGLALVRGFRLAGRSSGVLAWIAQAYLLSFALLSPLSLLCYALHLPVIVFAAGWALIVAWGGWRTFRRLELRSVLQAFRPTSWITVLCATVLVAELLASTRIGGLANDGRFHIARVRMLLDHGFNSWDPYMLPHQFSRIYHTNLYTALMAALSWICGDRYEAWTLSLPWAKLVQGAGIYWCALTVFRRRDVAWLSVVALVIWRCMTIYANYQSQLCAFWLLPLALAYVIRIMREPRAGASLWLFMITIGVIVQVHALYAVLVALVLIPIFALGWLGRCRASEPGVQPRVFVLAGLSFMLLIPFIAATKLIDRPSEQDRQLAPVAARALDPPLDPAPELPIVTLGGTYRAADPHTLHDVSYAQPWLLAVFSLLLLGRSRCKGAARSLTLVGLLVGSLLYLPGVFGAAAAIAGQEWIVSRLVIFFPMLLIVLGPGALAVLLPRSKARRATRIALVGFSLAAPVFALGIQGASHWGLYARGLRDNQRAQTVASLNEQRSFFTSVIPPGSTLLAHPTRARGPAIHHDVYSVAVREGSPDLPGWGRRVLDANLLWNPETAPGLRARLTEKYDVSHVLAVGKHELELALELYAGEVSHVYRRQRIAVLELGTTKRAKPVFTNWKPDLARGARHE